MTSRYMKNSGIDWIGEIPSHWHLVSVKQLFSVGRGRVIARTELDENGTYPVYSSQTKNNGILGYIDTYDYDISQLTWTTDGANAGTVFLREGKHNCTNVCGTLTPKSEDINLKYMKYTLEYIAIFHKRADTNGYKIMSNEMAVIKTILPPKEEQQKIAAFLDEKVAHIDNIIEETKKSIENLKAYKQSLITETVTKGLNPNVEMKDSGVEWIGEIPKHWSVGSLNKLSQITMGQSPVSSSYNEKGDGLPFYQGKSDFGTTYPTPTIWCTSPSKIAESKDILISVRAPVGDVNICMEKSCIGRGLAAIREKYNITFYAYLFYSISILKNEFESLSTGTTFKGISSDTFKRIYLPLPSIYEQKQISEYLDEKSRTIESTIEQKELLINELEAYKKSLIYEYVTGKKEVK